MVGENKLRLQVSPDRCKPPRLRYIQRRQPGTQPKSPTEAPSTSLRMFGRSWATRGGSPEADPPRGSPIPSPDPALLLVWSDFWQVTVLPHATLTFESTRVGEQCGEQGGDLGLATLPRGPAHLMMPTARERRIMADKVCFQSSGPMAGRAGSVKLSRRCQRRGRPTSPTSDGNCPRPRKVKGEGGRRPRGGGGRRGARLA